MGEYSKVEIDGRLMIVTINRPEVYNACHPMANQELSDVFDRFQEDPDLWVAIITGAGDKAFSTGNDLWVGASGAGTAIVGFTGARTASRMGRSWDSCLTRITRSQARSNFFQPAL